MKAFDPSIAWWVIHVACLAPRGEVNLGFTSRGAFGDLAGDRPGVEPGRGAPLDDEAPDVPVVVTRPDHDDVGERRVADPAFAPVKDPLVPVAAGTGLQVHDVRAVLWLGQRERPDPIEALHRGEPPVLLLLRAQHRDGAEREPRVDAVERRDAPVAARELHRRKARGPVAHARPAVGAQPPPAIPSEARCGTSSNGNSARSQ